MSSGSLESVDSGGYKTGYPDRPPPKSSHYVIKTSDIETVPYGTSVWLSLPVHFTSGDSSTIDLMLPTSSVVETNDTNSTLKSNIVIIYII